MHNSEENYMCVGRDLCVHMVHIPSLQQHLWPGSLCQSQKPVASNNE